MVAVGDLPGSELHIFGDGPLRPRVERWKAELAAGGDAARFHLHGFADPAAALAAIDVLVLPSTAEGFGNALIEAMAAGVPVVGTDVPGIRNVIDHDRTGLLVPLHDAPALAAALARLRREPALGARLALAALGKVRETWTWDRVIPQYRALLRAPVRAP